MTEHFQKALHLANELLSSGQEGFYIARYRKWFFFSRYYLFVWDRRARGAIHAGSFSSFQKARKYGLMYVGKGQDQV